MSHRVTLQTSGKSFDVRSGETVLEAALREGLVLPYSCRSGTCGTCKGRVISGSIDYGQYQDRALDDAEREQGLALLCQARPLEDLVIDAREVVAAESIEIRMLPCRVVGMNCLAHDVMELHLRLPQNQRFAYLPGQYVDLLLRDGRRRSFSIANAPREDGTLDLHIRRVPGGFFSNHVFTEMKEGDLLRFQGPFGTFFLREDSERPTILMAGGTGFAPIKAIVEHAIEVGTERRMHLFWGVRARRDLYLVETVEAWLARFPPLRFTPVLSDPLPDDAWDGARGWVHEAVIAAYPEMNSFDVYASGPPPMIEAARKAFRAHGLPREQLYYDSFEFAADVPKQ